MSEIRIIQTALEKTSTRQRWQNGWRGFWRGLLIGSCVWLLGLAIYKWLPVAPIVLGVTGILGCLATVVGFLVGWRRRPTLPETARWVDEKKNLKERISTALEVASNENSGAWKELVITDAIKHADVINPRQLLPFSLPRGSRWVLLSLALAAGMGFIPEYRTQHYVQKQRDAQIIKETGKTLAELTRRSLEHRTPALEPTRKALDNVAELGDFLSKAKLTRAEALKDLANVAEKLKDEARDLAKNPSLKAMEKAAREPNTGGMKGAAELQKQIDALQKTLEQQAKGADPKALEKFAKDLKKAKDAASGLPDGNASDNQAARDQLERSLSDLAKSAKDLGLNLPSLDEAIAALAASQNDQMLKDLKVTEVELEKLEAMAKALAELQAKAEKLGKDLGEQLQNGQTEAAQATLQKMAEQLQSGNPNQDQLKKILDEVTRAVSPASQYGKIADLLKQGAEQLKQGEKPGAAQSLAEAAKELDKMMQQLGDGKAIMASLEALQKAQMCIGNGQGWGQCKAPPRAGKGGGIGRGVGTWADDSRLMDITDIKDRWDNSGVARADMDGRGLTDRGDGQLPDSLLPTKVKGQMNPGGPMPSITLKGVSIKGQSKVSFSEMATAAQTEAQAALSQEQVPRAYQGAVRDYFDDLKK